MLCTVVTSSFLFIFYGYAVRGRVPGGGYTHGSDHSMSFKLHAERYVDVEFMEIKEKGQN